MTQVLALEKIEWTVARLWRVNDNFALEKEFKTSVKNAPCYCPICTPAAATFRKLDDFPLGLAQMPLTSTEIKLSIINTETTDDELHNHG